MAIKYMHPVFFLIQANFTYITKVSIWVNKLPLAEDKSGKGGRLRTTSKDIM